MPRPALVASPFGWTGPGQTAPDLRSRAPRLWPRTVGAVGAILALVGMLALVGILAVAWLSRGDTLPADSLAARGYPRVVIMPFVAVDSSEGSRALSASLGAELIHDLRHFEGFRIYQPPDGSDLVSIAAKLRGEPGALYAVYGQIQAEGAWARINASLHDLRTEEVIWNAAYDVAIAPGALVDLRDAVAGRIATALGQPYGPISEDLGRSNSSAQPASLDSYRCVLASYDYRRNFSSTAYGPMLACLEAAVARDPEYSDAWAMLGWLHLDAGRYEFPGAAPMEAEYTAALAAARHAQALAPESVLALKALSSIQHYRGRYDESERLARRAVELNPHDPDSLAQLGWRLAVRGKFDEGVPLLRQAIDRTVDPPGWYFHLIAIDHLMKGDYAAMRREAERAALSGRPIAEALLAIAAGGLGDRETARAALNRIDPGSLIGRDAATYFRRHGATEEIVTALMDGLDRARRLAADPPPR